MSLEFNVRSKEETQALGRCLGSTLLDFVTMHPEGRVLKRHLCVAVEGPEGSGKTVFSEAFGDVTKCGTGYLKTERRFWSEWRNEWPDGLWPNRPVQIRRFDAQIYNRDGINAYIEPETIPFERRSKAQKVICHINPEQYPSVPGPTGSGIDLIEHGVSGDKILNAPLRDIDVLAVLTGRPSDATAARDLIDRRITIKYCPDLFPFDFLRQGLSPVSSKIQDQNTILSGHAALSHVAGELIFQ